MESHLAIEPWGIWAEVLHDDTEADRAVRHVRGWISSQTQLVPMPWPEASMYMCVCVCVCVCV